jgi:hypothetical protein
MGAWILRLFDCTELPGYRFPPEIIVPCVESVGPTSSQVNELLLEAGCVLGGVGSPCVATLSERLLFGVFYRAFE